MYEDLLGELPADSAALLELGVALGQNHAFGLIAGRCSAAQAEGLHRLREEKLYKRCTEKWDDFCPRFLKISRSEADRTIKLWEEFGAAYFELSQLTRVSPETFRAIAPAIQDGALHYNGEVIELNSGNSRKVATAVAELRSTLPKRFTESRSLMREVQGLCHEADLTVRIEKLNECCTALVAEFEKISRDEGLGPARMLFNSALALVRSELGACGGEERNYLAFSITARSDRRYAAKRVIAEDPRDREGNSSTTDAAFLDAQTMHCCGSGAGDSASNLLNVERIAASTASLYGLAGHSSTECNRECSNFIHCPRGSLGWLNVMQPP